MPFDVIKSETVFTGKILKVKHDYLSTPEGGEMFREVVVSREAVAILPIDANGNIVFVRQYRHGAGKQTIEIPAGIIEPGEPPQIAAARELKEETGYIANELIYLTPLRTTPGFCTETVHLFLAACGHQTSQDLDADEFISLEVHTPAEALEMIHKQIITDCKTIAGVLFCLCRGGYLG